MAHLDGNHSVGRLEIDLLEGESAEIADIMGEDVVVSE